MIRTEDVRGIPYGVSNYGRIVERNYYYVDKTDYLEAVEKVGEYLFFIRPRRFGKSLFLSVIEAYYDVLYKDSFDELFKGTRVHKNPTGERGTYLVLKFNFSMVDPGVDKMENSFLHHIRGKARVFLEKYTGYLSKKKNYYEKTIEECNSASDVLSAIIDLCEVSRQKLYVIIDEYDNFANTVISISGTDAYQSLTHGSGFFRSFFNILKGGTTGTGAPITRSFITGVSPITMDDVTSGYNIGKNVSLDPVFNRMLGFTRQDVIEMIEYYRSNGLIRHRTDDLLEIMTQWYGNYLFSRDDDFRMYNSDMILYFVDNYLGKEKLPDDLIDNNVRIDYDKLRHLIIVDRDKGKEIKPSPNGNFSKLKEILEKGGTSSKIVPGFPLEKIIDPENFCSLLFYLGLLTIKGPEKDRLYLNIPNETIKRLYYDYIKETYRETGIFSLDLAKYSDLMTELAYDGKWRPLFEFIAGRMRESMSLRDLITGEKSIQAFLNVYLGLSDLYIIHSEKELNKGFADIVMEPFLARYEGIKYSYVLEIKYIKTGMKPGDAEIQRLKTGAEKQLKVYTSDEKFGKNMEKTRLIKLVLIFSGHDLIYRDKVG